MASLVKEKERENKELSDKIKRQDYRLKIAKK